MDGTNAGITWDGRSRWWQHSSTQEAQPDANLLMLAQDLGMDIWAHFHQLGKREAARGERYITIENCTAPLAELLARSLPASGRTGGNLLAGLRDSVQTAATQLALGIDIAYEIQFAWPARSAMPAAAASRQVAPATQEPDKAENAENKPSPVAAAMRPIRAESLVRSGRQICQVLPKGPGEETSTRVALRPERVLAMMLPQQWQQSLVRLRGVLPLISGSNQSAGQVAMEAQQRSHREFSIALARATAELGWLGRGAFDEWMTDYYYCARLLRWRRFCIEVRDQIVKVLADGVARAGREFGEKPVLVVKGLPAIADLDEAAARLAGGNARVDAVIASLLGQTLQKKPQNQLRVTQKPAAAKYAEAL